MFTEAITRDQAKIHELVSIDEAREFCRVYHYHEDAKFESLLNAAISYTESVTMPLVNQTQRHWLESFSQKVTLLPGVESITSVHYYNADGTLVEIPSSNYVVEFSTVNFGTFMPTNISTSREYVVVIVAVYNRNVPDELKLAVKVLVGHWYDNPGIINVGNTVSGLPDSYSSLIANYRNFNAKS